MSSSTLGSFPTSNSLRDFTEQFVCSALHGSASLISLRAIEMAAAGAVDYHKNPPPPPISQLSATRDFWKKVGEGYDRRACP